MKKSDFRRAYLSFARLYGAIYSDEAYLILKRYCPNLKKSELNRDLKSRYLTRTRGYDIFSCGYQQYVITRAYFVCDDIDYTFHEQGAKPYFVPETFEDFLEYGNEERVLLANPKYEQDLKCFLKRHIKLKEYEEEETPLNKDKYIDIAAYCLIRHMELELEMEEIIEFANRFGLELSEFKVMQKFLKIMQNIFNNTRNFYNRGYTPIELKKMSGRQDFSKVEITLGEDAKRMFLSGELDPFEYIQTIETSDLPLEVKKSLKEEVLKFIKEIKEGRA